jgi:hypothetical protein
MERILKRVSVVVLNCLFFFMTVTFVLTAGAEKQVIKHYGIVDLTGPYGILVPDVWESMLDYYRLVNEEGGIEGYPVKLVWGETGNMMARTWSHYKRYKRANAQLLWLASSPDGEALKRRLAQDKMFCPLNYGQSDPQIYRYHWAGHGLWKGRP